ncbi:MAG: NAD(+)/NADH kinase [Brevinema sp.]
MSKVIITGKTKETEFASIFTTLYKELDKLGVEHITIDSDTPVPCDDFDLVFCVGGDGNFIAAARKFVPFDKPLIGINAGRLCFLPNIHPSEIPTKIPPLFLEPEQDWTRRLVIHGHNKDNELVALNEFLFSSIQKGVLSQFSIFIDDHKVMSIRADGLLVATATGSTAYNLSAGGPITMPDTDVLIITPVCSHILGERPLVIGLNKQIKIVNSSKMEYNIWADGQVAIPFSPNDEFIISEPKYIKTPAQSSKEFFETLGLKLGWNPKNIIEK